VTRADDRLVIISKSIQIVQIFSRYNNLPRVEVVVVKEKQK